MAQALRTLDNLTFGPKRKKDGVTTRTFSSTYLFEDDGQQYGVSGQVALLDGQWQLTSLTITGERGVPSRVRQVVPLRPILFGAAAADLTEEPPVFVVPDGRAVLTPEFLSGLADRLRWLGTRHRDPVKVLAEESGLDPKDSRLGFWLKVARNQGLLDASPNARAS